MKKKEKEERNKLIIEDYINLLSIKKIEEKYNLEKPQIYNILKNNNIEKRRKWGK